MFYPGYYARDLFLKVAQKKMNRKEFYQVHRAIITELLDVRKRLKNPINLRNVKPLSATTIKNRDFPG